MRIDGSVALVSGGGSGLGLAAARWLAERGARVVRLDRTFPVDDDVGSGRSTAIDVTGDVLVPDDVARAVVAAEQVGELRILVHTAGIGGPLRILDRSGAPADLEAYTRVVTVNLIGTFNVLRLAAAGMANSSVLEGERGVCVLTSSVAAFEGRIGQVHYAASKAGIAGMTLPAARDLASRLIRVCSIAPGVFDTPLLGRLPEAIRQQLGADSPHPSRLGRPGEFAALAGHIVENPMLNGETIRLDGALRMTPR